MAATSLIVIGGLNTDIVARGLKRFPRPGEHVYGRDLLIGPGGKSRNIAAMAGHLLPKDTVAMIGRTVQDPYGLWNPPLAALRQAGVNTDYVRVLQPAETDKLPAIALIVVNEQGENQIVVVPGVSDDFSPADIDAAQQLFDTVSTNQGFLGLTLECPLPTAKYAIEKAAALGIKVVLDPGGLQRDTDITDFLSRLYLIKPNEHEAHMLTGVEVVDAETAGQAAKVLQAKGVPNVMITHGRHGAYVFMGSAAAHVPIPAVSGAGDKDATGCGDQVMAALCAYLQLGRPLEAAARAAVTAGTLQFHKAGIQPVSRQELEARL